MAKGQARAGWDIDLADGELAEAWLARILREGPVENRYVESKFNESGRETHNVFVELEQKGRPSGFATTEAGWWALWMDHRVVVLVLRETLGRMVERAQEQGKVKMGGDHDLFRGVLVPIEWLVQPWEFDPKPAPEEDGF